jgi:excisionase family DNA binding protein
VKAAAPLGAPRLAGYRELASYLTVPESTLRTWVQRDQIPHLRLSAHCVRFNLDAIDGWLASKRRGIAGVR